jgi:hypothetical protein
MSLVTIAADLPSLDDVLKAVERAGNGKLTYTREAVKSSTEIIQRTWIQYAQGARVNYSGGTFHVNTVTGSYVRSIQEGLRFKDDLTGEVFTTSPHGKIIEDGQPARDMKPKLLASPKAKVGKDGKKFITVPFRHGTPNTVGLPAMPAHIYAQAKNLGFSRRNSMLKRVWTGKTYEWGGRLGKSADGQRSHIAPSQRVNSEGQGYTHRTGIYSGMVRMGQKNHAQYMTFRRLSENSDPRSWQYPAVKPRPIRDAVVENTREEVLMLIRRGFEMDLYFMGLGE